MDTLATQLLQKIQQGELSYEDIRAKLDAINAAPNYTIEEERLVLAFLDVLSYKVSKPIIAEDTGYRTYQDRIGHKVSQFVKRIFSILRGQ